MGIWGQMTEKALMINTSIFAKFGAAMGSKVGSVLMFIAGLGIVAFLSVKVDDVEYEDVLAKLWIEEGSRAEDELEYNAHVFGGLGRIASYAVSVDQDEPVSDGDPGVMFKEALYALGNISFPAVNPDTTGDYIKVPVELGAETVNLTTRDYCDRPELPGVFKSYVTSPLFAYDDPLLIGSWASVGALFSGSLNFMTRCLAAKATHVLTTYNSTTVAEVNYYQLQIFYETLGINVLTELDADSTRKTTVTDMKTGLPNGWGLDRAPCSIASPLDCWNDGKFTYPAEFKQMDNYGFALGALSQTQAGQTLELLRGGGVFAFDGGSSDPTEQAYWFTLCAGEYIAAVDAAIGGAFPIPGVAANSAELFNFFADGGLSAAVGWGYWWRPSLEDADASGDVVDSFISGARNVVNQLDPSDCVTANVGRKLSGVVSRTTGGFPPTGVSAGAYCCYSWAASVVNPALHTGGFLPEDWFSTVTAPTDPFIAATRLVVTGPHHDNKLFQKRLETEHMLAATPNGDDLEEGVWDLEQAIIDNMIGAHEKDAGTEFGPGTTYHDTLTYDFIVDRAVSDMLADASDIETDLLIIGYAVLIVYACSNFVVWKCSSDAFVYQRVFLCFIGICTIGLSTLASFGFVAWIELELSPLNVMLIPFLAMGLGIDDLFVMMHELGRHHAYHEAPEQRMVLTMADAGASVTVTSMANAVAFLIASTIRLPAVYTFAYQMAASIILNWLCLMLIFGPCMYWDSIRVAAQSCLCVKSETDETTVRGGESAFSLRTFVEKYMAPLYANTVFKILSMVVFFGLTITLAILGFLNIEKGLQLSDVALKGSSQRSYVVLLEDHFPILSGNILTRPINYTESDGSPVLFPDFQENIGQFMADMANDTYVDGDLAPPSSGYFLADLQDAAGVSPIPSGSFYPALQAFLQGTGSIWSSDLACRDLNTDEFPVSCGDADGVNKILEATKGAIYFVDLVDDPAYVKAIKSIRDTADASIANKENCCTDEPGDDFDPPKLFVYGSLMNYWQQYIGAEETTFRVVGFALCGVFGTTLLFQASPLSSLYICAMIFATVFQMYGLMWIMGIKLNGFSITNLAVSVGMAVEFTAHITHAFLRANAVTTDRNQRVAIALAEMFPPMLSGAITTFVSVVCLGFARYSFFSLYYFQMFAVMVLLSFVNGMVFLPVILSVIGPPGLDKRHRQMSIKNSMKHGSKEGAEKDMLEDDAL